MSALANLNPWLGVTTVAASMLGLILALRVLQRWGALHAEAARKLFHLGGGLLALSLPWLFQEPWPVLVLTGATLAVFVALRRVPALARGPGQVLHAVARQSHGEFYFPLGVCLVFLLAGGAKVLYVVPVLVLAVADTSAALIGKAYGRHHLTGPHGCKTVEGSISFFLTSFLCVHVPLLLWTDAGRLESLLVAFNLAFILMLAEAVASRGTDNLLLPLLTFMLLDAFLEKPVLDLVVQLSAVTCLTALLYVWRFRAMPLREQPLPGALE